MDGIRAIVVASDASKVGEWQAQKNGKAAGNKATYRSGLWSFARHATRLEIERSLSKKKTQNTNLKKDGTVSASSLQRLKTSNAQN